MTAVLSPRRQRATAAFAASVVAFAGSYALLGAGIGAASSHREAPMITNDPAVDNTDVYAFVSPDDPDMTTLLANFAPFSSPGQGPNFYPFAENARYNIKIDNNGDAVPDVTYRWTFTTEDLRPEIDYEDAADGTFLYNNGPVRSFDDENLLFRQRYTLEKVDAEGNATTLLKDAPVAPDYVGPGSMPDYPSLREDGISDLDGGGAAFAGPADDPFFLDIRVFDLLYGGDLSERGADSVAGSNVNTIALQVPTSSLVDGDPVIGMWSTTERPSTEVTNPDGSRDFDGDFVQVSRLGNPLVNEVVIPVGLKDAFNALAPAQDATVEAAVNRVLQPEVPVLIEKIYGIEAPGGPRDDLFTVFLTGLKGLNKPSGQVQPAELLRLNTSIPPADDPARLGVLAGDNAGFPNGRRLTDDVVDVELQALEGAVQVSERGGKATGVDIVEPLAEGDKVFSNDREFKDTFPYVALPHSPKGSPALNSPSGGVDAGGGGTAGTDPGEALAAAGTEEGIGTTLLPASAAAAGVLFAVVGVLALRRGRTGTAGRR